MPYDPFAAQSAALNKRSTLQNLDLGNPVSPGAAAAALSTPQEEQRNEYGGFDSAGSTNDPEVARMNAARARSDAEYARRNAPPSATLAPGSFKVT